MSTNVKLQPSNEILKYKESTQGKIELTAPIDLSALQNTQNVTAAKPEPAVIASKPVTASPQKAPPPAPVLEGQTKIIKIERTRLQPMSINALGEGTKIKSRIELPSKVIQKKPVAKVPDQEPKIVIEKTTTNEKSILIEPSVDIQSIQKVEISKQISKPIPSPTPIVMTLQADEAPPAELSYLFNTQIKEPKPVAAATPPPPPPKTTTKTTTVAKGKPAATADIETLKNYLSLREQDLSVMKLQMDYSREELNKAQDIMKKLTIENENLQHQISSFKDQVDLQRNRKNIDDRSFVVEADRFKIEIKMKSEQIKQLDEKLKETVLEQERLKERVRLDIRKIRVRERELESKLEILKRDSETLIVSRENKIVELKRKIDLLEFNYDMLQDKYEKEKNNYMELLNKEQELAKVLKKALGLMDDDSEVDVKKIKSV